MGTVDRSAPGFQEQQPQDNSRELGGSDRSARAPWTIMVGIAIGLLSGLGTGFAAGATAAKTVTPMVGILAGAAVGIGASALATVTAIVGLHAIFDESTQR
jgi:hypothetical protein